MSVTQGQLQNKLFAHPFIQSFNPYSRAVFDKLNHCHTAHIGMHRFQCDQGACGFQHWQYHSCGNRHCPNCGAFKKEQCPPERNGQGLTLKLLSSYLLLTITWCSPYHMN